MDMACVQETWWRGSRCRFFGAIGKRYKLFWTDGVGIFVAEKWVDSVVSVERHSERELRTGPEDGLRCFHGICSSFRET